MIGSIIFILILLILNIPVSFIFYKAWVNSIHAFIPFVNVLQYIRIIGFKNRYIVAVLMILSCLFLAWDTKKGLWLYATWFYHGLLIWISLLYAIPVLMAFWVIFWIWSLLSTFMCLIWAWKYCSLYHEYTPLVFFWSIFMFIFLNFFYFKLAYNLALKFWWTKKNALLHIFFQPITIWLIGCWPSKYHDKYYHEELQDNKIWGLDAHDFYSVDEMNTVHWKPQVVGGSKTVDLEKEQQKKNNRFFRRAMLIIVAILVWLFLYRAVPSYLNANKQLKEKEAKAKEETSVILEKLVSWDYECKDPWYRPWQAYIALKLPEGIKSYWTNWTIFSWRNDWKCYEAYNLNYSEYNDDERISIFDYYISDFNTKEPLFRCTERNDEVVLLEYTWDKYDTNKWCSTLYDRFYKQYKHWFVAYDKNWKLKDYDDFDDPVLSQKIKELNLAITDSCEYIFRTKWNTYYDRYYYLTWKNELILLWQIWNQYNECEDYNEIIQWALNWVVLTKE